MKIRQKTDTLTMSSTGDERLVDVVPDYGQGHFITAVLLQEC